MPSQKEDVWFVYDGAYPICNMGADLYRVRQSVGALYSIDARTEKDHPIMQEVNAAGLDLDAGMVIKYEGKLHQGAEALHVMAQLGSGQGWFNRLNNRLFHSRKLAQFCYPALREARNLALRIKRENKIANLTKGGAL